MLADVSLLSLPSSFLHHPLETLHCPGNQPRPLPLHTRCQTWLCMADPQSILQEINPVYSLEDWRWNWSSNTSATWCEEPAHRKDPDSGKDWGQWGKGATEDEMVGLHHQLSGLEFKQSPGDSEGQGSLLCCSPWGRGVGHNWVNWTEWLIPWCCVHAWG